ncbi:MAG: hypothetical protein WBG19_08410 [Thermoplasmata archaeon]
MGASTAAAGRPPAAKRRGWAIRVVASLLAGTAGVPSVTCWTGPTGGFSQFHLDEANLGSEDGAVAGSDYNYNWTVDQYCFHILEDAPSSENLSCSAVPTPSVGGGPMPPGVGGLAPPLPFAGAPAAPATDTRPARGWSLPRSVSGGSRSIATSDGSPPRRRG